MKANLNSIALQTQNQNPKQPLKAETLKGKWIKPEIQLKHFLHLSFVVGVGTISFSHPITYPAVIMNTWAGRRRRHRTPLRSWGRCCCCCRKQTETNNFWYFMWKGASKITVLPGCPGLHTRRRTGQPSCCGTFPETGFAWFIIGLLVTGLN